MSPPPITTFPELLERARVGHTPRMAVASAGETAVIASVAHAMAEGLIEPVLVGDAARIRVLADQQSVDLSAVDIRDIPAPAEAAGAAVRLVHQGQAALVMKGLVTTRDFVRAVLNQELGIRRGRPLSHVAVIESPDQTRLMLLTDSGINIRPRFHRKIAIVKNALAVANTLGIAVPRVAVIAAVETVELPAMPATLDAALLKRLGDSGQLGPCIVDGPLSMDNALDGHTAEVKGRAGPVSGKADILVAPDIETANAVYKTIRYMARREIAGTVFGASAPAVVSSRSDSATSKLYSIALAVLLSRQFEHDH